MSQAAEGVRKYLNTFEEDGVRALQSAIRHKNLSIAKLLLCELGFIDTTDEERN